MSETLENKKELTPSKYQEAILEWASDPNPENKVAMISAVAGSGKTSSALMVCSKIPHGQKALFVAFNKRVVNDLRGRLPANADAKTLNSVGFSTWMRFIGKSFSELGQDFVNGSLNYRLIEKWINKDGKLSHEIKSAMLDKFRKVRGAGPELEQYGRILGGNFGEEVGAINRLVSLAKGFGMPPTMCSAYSSGEYTGLIEDTSENWRGIINEYGLDISFPEISIEISRRVLAESFGLADKEIDYDSQMWLPVICNAKFYTYDWILVDEAQDLNSIQGEMVARMFKSSTRAAFFGDENQSIYFFRGSASNGMSILKEKFGATELPLSICYRCAKSIVAHAKKIVPHIEHSDHQEDGKVVYATEYGPNCFGKNDAILCRNTRYLVNLSHKLYKAKVPNRILGKDIEHGLVSLAKKCAGKTGDFELIEDRLQSYLERETEKYKKKNQYDMAERVTDKVETLRIFIRDLPEYSRTLKALIDSINETFNMDKVNQKQMLVLATCHAAKGGEWDKVFILNKGLMPSKYAVSREAIQQERNIMYVARTRAKKTLIYIEDDGYNPSYLSDKVLTDEPE